MESHDLVVALQPLVSGGTKFSTPSSPVLDLGKARWTNWGAPSFGATVKPKEIRDVQAIVKYCTEHDLPFLAVSSGHGYTPAYGKAKSILQIDLNNFKDIMIHDDMRSITIGGAVTHAEVLEPLWAVRKQMPIGGCSTTGIVGVTLGGGLNRWQGEFGLHCDSLVEVQMVLASGDLVTASKAENTELFWGIRGAGFNFGIIVSATYRIYDLLNDGKTLVADMILPFAKSIDLIKVLKLWEIDQDPKLAIATGAMWSPEMNGPAHLVSLLYHGDRAVGMNLAQQILDLGPIMQNVYDCNWNEIPYKWAFGIDKLTSSYGGLKNNYSGHIKYMDIATFEWYYSELAKLWEEYPACRGTVMLLEDWPTKQVEDIPDDETAFPHRDVKCQMVLLCQTEDPALTGMLDAWGKKARDRFQETNGFGENKVYVSYAQGDETQESIYGARKLDRLRALKRKYDPRQMFSWNNPIKI